MHTQKSARQPTAASSRRSTVRSTAPTRPQATGPRTLERAAANPTQASATDILALQRQYGNRAVQRVLAQRPAPVGLEGGEVSPEIGRAIEQARGGGYALDHPAAEKIGAALGADFSHVRIHTDAQSDQINRSLSARAFTLGSDIFFGHGNYQPGSASGQSLLAHELTHVVQQGAAGGSQVQAKLTVGAAHDRYEQEADQTAEWVMRQIDQPADEAGDRRPVARVQRVPVLRRSRAGGIQRAVGFEFQTGWGLVRRLNAPPLAPVTDRANEPRPDVQGDYEDEALAHPNTPAPAQLTRGQRFKRWFKRNILRQQPPAAPLPNPNAPVRVSDTQWRDPVTGTITTRPTAGHHYKFFKGQCLKDFGTYRLTVDDATTPLGAELEWVVHPPVQESNDVAVLEGIMDNLKGTVDDLLVFKDRESFTLDEATHDNADAHVEIQPGIKGNGFRNMAAPAQATGGVGMDQLLTMFEDMSKAPNAQRTPESAAGVSVLAGAAGASAGAAASVGAHAPGSARLKGLVAYIYRYLSMGAFVHGQAGQQYNLATPYAKNLTMFLARTDFKKMFSLLPRNELDLFGGAAYGGDNGKVAAFVAMVTKAITDSGRPINLDRRVFERGIKGGDGHTIKNIDITCRAWLEGIANGSGDLLSSKYQAAIGNLNNAGELESMGNLGGKVDRVGTDAGNLASYTGIVTEFRGETGQRTPDEWKPYAVKVFNYLKQLNARPRG